MMNTTTTTTTTIPSKESQVLPIPDEWLDYFYHQQFNGVNNFDVPFAGTAVSEDSGFGDKTIGFFDAPGSDAAAGTERSAAASSATVISLENSATAAGDDSNNNVDLSPKGGIGKQVKRRTRASRRTPTTLVNSSIKNFRSVVQQYTGFRSSTASGFNSVDGKGPITLNFGAPQ
ncbi:OLC1v1025469C1 [Oldenlandia corymbosa var. corymbosa]|uniref:OLC1v1025469C1 n=1 Tax=Oldenlandia corymbosa var. corymbosa TaxID=529605 RepID=A0AAV1C5G0_OLDCO|nr:OLC1v1025469C1 [Oldenlandia corymbosa var. corymbosa]